MHMSFFMLYFNNTTRYILNIYYRIPLMHIMIFIEMKIKIKYVVNSRNFVTVSLSIVPFYFLILLYFSATSRHQWLPNNKPSFNLMITIGEFWSNISLPLLLFCESFNLSWDFICICVCAYLQFLWYLSSLFFCE